MFLPLSASENVVFFPALYPLQTGPQERLSRQESVPTAHAQAQSPHPEVCCLPCFHWKVRRHQALHKQRKLCVIIFIFLKADHVSRLSRWYTTNDQFAPSDPCLFCDKCFRVMHYDAQGNKVGEFLAYPYVDRGAFN